MQHTEMPKQMTLHIISEGGMQHTEMPKQMTLQQTF